VVHGLWFEWMFNLRELTAERTMAVHRAVIELLQSRGARSAAGAAGKVTV
jgi:hypothetical protein